MDPVKKGDVFKNSRTGAMVEITAWPDEIADPGKVEIRRLLRPGMGFPLPHVHLDMDETFRVEFGVADARIGHRAIRIFQGQEFRVPRHSVHTNPRNRSTRDLVVVQTFESAITDASKRYVETLARFICEGRDVRGDLPAVVALAIFAGRDQQTFGPWVPRGVQHRLIFPVARYVDDWNEDRRRLRQEEADAAGEESPSTAGRPGWPRFRFDGR